MAADSRPSDLICSITGISTGVHDAQKTLHTRTIVEILFPKYATNIALAIGIKRMIVPAKPTGGSGQGSPDGSLQAEALYGLAAHSPSCSPKSPQSVAVGQDAPVPV